MKLLKEIEDYCKLNDISDIEKFVNECTKVGFMSIKYKKPGLEIKDVPVEQQPVDENPIKPIKVEKKIIKTENKYDIYGEDL